MRKRPNKLAAIITGILAALILLTMSYLLIRAFFSDFSTMSNAPVCTNEERCNSLHWIKEESEYIGSDVQGDHVQIQYALVFENHSDVDYRCDYLGAKFSFWDLFGWMKYEQFFDGYCDDGTTEFIVPGGEKVKITFSFTGEYTGGKIRSELSVPVEVMFMQRMAE